MAKIYGYDIADFAAKNLVSFGSLFTRMNGQPLDESSIYYPAYVNDKWEVVKANTEGAVYKTGLERATRYAATNAAYVGQELAVINVTLGEDNTTVIGTDVTFYGIQDSNGTLKEIGCKPIGDEATVTVSENGEISLFGLNEIEEIEDENGNSIAYQPRYENGVLSWVKVGGTTIEDVSSELTELNSKIGKTNERLDNLVIPEVPENISEFTNDVGYQTAGDVEALISGTLATVLNHAIFKQVDEAPTLENAENNVLYLVPENGKYEIYAKIDNEIINIDDTDVDLTNYVKDSELAATLIDYAKNTDLKNYVQNSELEDYVKQDTLNNYVLSSVLETLISKDNFEETLTASSTIESLINAAKIAHNHDNKPILDSITEDLIEKWNLGESNLITKVTDEFTLEDKTLAINLISISKVNGLSDRLDNIDSTLENLDFQTILDSISINGEALKIDENKNIDLPIASNTALGLILGKGSLEENKIKIEEDGTLSVYSLNVNRLVQDKDSYLVLNGGNASLTNDEN